MKASNVLNIIAAAAWDCGCPGILFLDRINKDNHYAALHNMQFKSEKAN